MNSSKANVERKMCVLCENRSLSAHVKYNVPTSRKQVVLAWTCTSCAHVVSHSCRALPVPHPFTPMDHNKTIDQNHKNKCVQPYKCPACVTVVEVKTKCE